MWGDLVVPLDEEERCNHAQGNGLFLFVRGRGGEPSRDGLSSICFLDAPGTWGNS